MAGKDDLFAPKLTRSGLVGEDGARAFMSRADMFVMMKSSPAEIWEEPNPALALHLHLFRRRYRVVLNLN